MFLTQLGTHMQTRKQPALTEACDCQSPATKHKQQRTQAPRRSTCKLRSASATDRRTDLRVQLQKITAACQDLQSAYVPVMCAHMAVVDSVIFVDHGRNRKSYL